MIVLLIIAGSGLVIRQKFFSKTEPSFITADAVRMDIEESVLATGSLKVFKTVAVGAQVSGQLKTLHVALGGQS